MKGACHCGAIAVELARKPEYINLCDCSLCLKSGGAWGYFTQTDVDVIGEAGSYRRSDHKEPAVQLHFCSKCGTATHWTLTEHFEGDRVGVNMRIFEPKELNGVEARTLDGRNWFGDGEANHRRPVGKLGEDVFL
uniref:GFA family protein n=1 Tax=uncultured Altererythrobacter sp. TaxID=500840 RepID=UPI0026204992|nr:GFA family protein [uncultured Altererythrobacter sp.]